MDLSLTTDSLGLWNDDTGYASSLFCQWNIAPDTDADGTTGIVVSSLSLIFEQFDVPVGYDAVRVYQLKCVPSADGNDVCETRERQLRLTYPASFADTGLLPPVVHAEENAQGYGVQLMVRFTSKYASGAKGFTATCRNM